MTSRTKLLFTVIGIDAVYGNVLTMGIPGDMAVYAARQAVVGLTDTLMNSDITLVLDQLEMFASHHGSGCNTGIQRGCLTAFNHGILPLTVGRYSNTEQRGRYQQ